jgi:hypothetical protein
MRHDVRPSVLIGLAAVLTLAACASGAGDGESETPLASRPAPIPIRSDETLPSGDGTAVPDSVMRAVIADVLERTGASQDDISVTTAEAVTWNDGSLGCPEPGMSYTQALVDGYHVVLEVAGETFDYRIGSGTDPRLCESPIEGGG